MSFTEEEILSELDKSAAGEPGRNFPRQQAGEVHYHFYPDLENGNTRIAGSYIHLYRTATDWAIVVELSTFNTHALQAAIELYVFGSAVYYDAHRSEKAGYVTNCHYIDLISEEELMRITQGSDHDAGGGEIIHPDITEVTVRGEKIKISHDPQEYAKHGITLGNIFNPYEEVEVGDLLRYLHETRPLLLRASEEEIQALFHAPMKKLLELQSFHYTSLDEETEPSDQELWQQIARVLVTGEEEAWNPSLMPNNHWSKWDSGML